MNEKLSFQNITDTLAQKAGVQKKVSETFTKAFFDTIVEALYMGEDTIKVKGLGTFRLVVVGSRESVNVSNGERIVIPGYKKVSFTPEDSVVELLNQNATTDEQHENAVTEPIETVKENDKAPSMTEKQGIEDDVENTNEVHDETQTATEINVEQVEIDVTTEQPEETIDKTETPTDPIIDDEPLHLVLDNTPNLDDLLQASVPEYVETPQDEFAGIDMLISTPESVDEVRQQLADATIKMNDAVEEARKAMEDKLRLQKLLERLEANVVPEMMEMDNCYKEKVVENTGDAPLEQSSSTVKETEAIQVSEDNTAEQIVIATNKAITEPSSSTFQDSPAENEEDKKNRAFERFIQDSHKEENEVITIRTKNKGTAWFIFIAILLLAVIIFFLHRTFISIDAVKDVTPPQEATKPKVEHPKKPHPMPTTKEKDSIQMAELAKDTSNVSPTKKETPQQPAEKVEEAKPSRPSTYIMKKGESLTRISQRFYGTKDSVRAIIRSNDFIDPDNVPVGAKVKLP